MALSGWTAVAFAGASTACQRLSGSDEPGAGGSEANEKAARAANGGAVPPDLSVMAKARAISSPFPQWIFNYFTTYSEGGPDYIHAIVTGYRKPPAGLEVPAGKLEPGEPHLDTAKRELLEETGYEGLAAELGIEELAVEPPAGVV